LGKTASSGKLNAASGSSGKGVDASANPGWASTTDSRQAGKEMKAVITFSAFSVIAMSIWLLADALGQSDKISLPTTLSAVRDFVQH
jgi:hypothetical protein